MNRYLGSMAVATGLLLVACTPPAPENIQSGYLYYEGSSEKAGSSGANAQVKGIFGVMDSCWTLTAGSETYFIALPKDTVTFKQDNGNLAVHMSGGTQLVAGQELDLGGSYTSKTASDDAALAELVTACPNVMPSLAGEGAASSSNEVWEVAVPNGYK